MKDRVKRILKRHQGRMEKRIWCKSGEDPNSTEHILARIFNRIIINPDTNCWNWQGTVNLQGYATMGINRKTRLVHRVLYQLLGNTIPSKMLLCHHCDNPKCVNPNHLFVGTQSDNMKDSFNKGRIKPPIISLYGEKNGMCKLTQDQVLEIRSLSSRGLSYSVIASKFHISPSHAGHIITGSRWQYLAGEKQGVLI